MTDEIKRRLEAAGVRLKPLIWENYRDRRWQSGNFRIVETIDPEYQYHEVKVVKTGLFPTLDQCVASVEAHRLAAVLALLEVADDALGA